MPQSKRSKTGKRAELSLAPAPPEPRSGQAKRISDKARDPKRDPHIASPETRKMIANMAGYGLDVLTICKLTGMSSATIYRHYKHEMQTSAAQKDLIVLQSAFLKAIGGPKQDWEKADAPMQRWWIERRQAGWAPPPQRTMNINANLDLSRLSDAELDELERIMEAASPGAESGGDPAREIGAAFEPEPGED
jgi:AraC-like DNA-binding protein